MDAVEYLKTLSRMCNCECCNCEFKKRLSGFESCTVWRKTHPDEAVAIVEKWAAEHPIKTRQSEFLKLFPSARVKKANGLPIALIIDAVSFFAIGAIYGLATRINQLEKIGYKVTKNDE